MKFELWYVTAKEIIQAILSFWFLPAKWKRFLNELLKVFDTLYSYATGTMDGNTFLDDIMINTKQGKVSFSVWYRSNRELIYGLSTLWFFGKKWKQVFKDILAAFDTATAGTSSFGVSSVSSVGVLLKSIQIGSPADLVGGRPPDRKPKQANKPHGL